MKDLGLLVWLTQLGMSVAVPLAGFTLLGVWLHNECGWGRWAVFAGLVLGAYCAVQGFRGSLRTMESFTKDKKKDSGPPPVSFNDHD